jgi:hypothetical protein
VSDTVASYEEQVRILEVAWQNQLTVVTSSLTAANTARENALHLLVRCLLLLGNLLPRLVDFAMLSQGLLR